MRICVIGDPHGAIKKIKKIPLKSVDLILLTGDLGKADFARQFYFENVKRKNEGLPEKKYTSKESKKSHMEIHNSTINILKYLSKFAPVYTIQGNVGIPTKAESKKRDKKYGIKHPPTRELIQKMKKVHLVKNMARNIGELKIGFLEYFIDTSWVKEFKPKDYSKKMKKAKKETDKAKKTLERFGKSINILICHQPPYGYLDKVSGKYGAPKQWQGKHAGSKAILNYVKKHKPKYVFCGHIHEGEGKKKIGNTEIYNLGVGSHKTILLNKN